MPDDPKKKIPREKRKSHHPFRRKPKPPLPGELLKEAEKVLVSSRARAQVMPKTTLADATDVFLARIPVAEAMEVLASQLEATTQIFDLNANRLITRPDGPTRQKALELWVHMVYGKPVERKIIENHQVDSMDDLKAKLATNPALRETLEKMIEEAEGVAK
jgi:hypothetical protein